MSFIRIYLRVLGLLRPDAKLAIAREKEAAKKAALEAKAAAAAAAAATPETTDAA